MFFESQNKFVMAAESKILELFSRTQFKDSKSILVKLLCSLCHIRKNGLCLQNYTYSIYYIKEFERNNETIKTVLIVGPAGKLLKGIGGPQEVPRTERRQSQSVAVRVENRCKSTDRDRSLFPRRFPRGDAPFDSSKL